MKNKKVKTSMITACALLLGVILSIYSLAIRSLTSPESPARTGNKAVAISSRDTRELMLSSGFYYQDAFVKRKKRPKYFTKYGEYFRFSKMHRSR